MKWGVTYEAGLEVSLFGLNSSLLIHFVDYVHLIQYVKSESSGKTVFLCRIV